MDENRPYYILIVWQRHLAQLGDASRTPSDLRKDYLYGFFPWICLVAVTLICKCSLEIRFMLIAKLCKNEL